MVTVLVASRGSREIGVRGALLFGACLALGVSLLFVAMLGQPFALIRTW